MAVRTLTALAAEISWKNIWNPLCSSSRCAASTASAAPQFPFLSPRANAIRVRNRALTWPPEPIACAPSSSYTECKSSGWSLTRRRAREVSLQQYRRHKSPARCCWTRTVAFRGFGRGPRRSELVRCAVPLRLPSLRRPFGKYFAASRLLRLLGRDSSDFGESLRNMRREFASPFPGLHLPAVRGRKAVFRASRGLWGL